VGTRNAFALGFVAPGAGSDISNNVTDRTESNPWAIGTASIAAGNPVPDDSTFAFALDLANGDVRNYLQQGLHQGVLGFAITSMHPASQGGGPPTPQFITRENTGAGAVPAMLLIDYQIVPEPGAVALAMTGLGCALSFFALGRRVRRKS
jgi:hypothetical protein